MNDRLFAEAQVMMEDAEKIRQHALSAAGPFADELYAEFEEAFAEARLAVLDARDAEPD